jgi:AAA domain
VKNTLPDLDNRVASLLRPPPGDAGPPIWQDDPELVADVAEFLSGEPSRNGRDPLLFETLAELCAVVDATGKRRWLIRGIWPDGDYGVRAAEMKAGKTWDTLDLGVSVASGNRGSERSRSTPRGQS